MIILISGGVSIAKIFIVDDKIFFHQMYRNLFELEGHEVIGSAFNGGEALKEYKKLETRPDIVLMDHLMPLKNGLEATEDILRYDPEAKIIFISVDKSIKKTALDLGAIKFITKPFQMQALIDNINKICNRNEKRGT